jgi:hypothetical protein
MKKEMIFFTLALIFSGSILFAQSNGRTFNSSQKTTMVNNQPKVYHPKTVLETDEQDLSKQLISENLFVTGKLGIGVDMTDGNIIPFTTMILKENNIRVLFDDSSTTGTFPANDWAIKINSTDDGGDSYYAIEDATALTTPFKIMAGAIDSAFVINSNGNIGFGTNTPTKDMHLNRGDTPAFRFEQNNTFGWGEQIWDVAANETNFFIRDVTNSNTLPFRIQPGAPSSSLTIRAEGYVGVGTWSPSTHLDVKGHIRTDSTLMLNPLTEVPASVEGGIYMDGNEHMLKVHNGTEWISIDNDSQDLIDATLTGTILQIDIENGASVSVDLQPLIADLESRIEALETLVSGKASVKYSSARLFQNSPNPFQNQTVINYYIPEDVENAVLKITGVNGASVKDVVIYERGEGSIVIDGNDTGKGTYFYSLVLDGQKIASKTLVKID